MPKGKGYPTKRRGATSKAKNSRRKTIEASAIKAVKPVKRKR